jgi:hypothetical protein
VFIYSSFGSWVFPLSCAVLPPPLSQAFLLLVTGWCCCSCQPPCLFTAHVGSGSSLLSCGVFLPPPLGLFIYSPRKDSLPPIFGAQGAPPSFQRVLFVLIAYYSVSLFSWGRGQSVQGAMLLWPRLVCGSSAVPRSSPGPRLPTPSGRWRLMARGPSLFLLLM